MADKRNIWSWGPIKNFPSMTTVPKMLRLSYFLTVKTWKLIAPRLPDYLQPSCCFDHLKNKQASSEEVCLQKTVKLLLSSHWLTYRMLLLGPCCCRILGRLLAVFLSHFLLYITTHLVHFCSWGRKAIIIIIWASANHLNSLNLISSSVQWK